MSDFLIKNTYLDYAKRHLHRVAAKLETEPLINGLRLRPRETRTVPADWVERNHAYLEVLVKSGVIEIIPPHGEVITEEAELPKVEQAVINPEAVEQLDLSNEPVRGVPELTTSIDESQEMPSTQVPTPVAPETTKPQSKKWNKKG